MINSTEKLRILIREALANIENKNTMSETGSNNENSGSEEIFEWTYFEEFGSRVLVRIGYTGDFDVLDEIKQELIENSGWKFDR